MLAVFFYMSCMTLGLLQDKNRENLYSIMCTMCRRDKLYQETEARRKRLAESLEMHQFLQDIYEVGSWISEKTQIASDESFRDESNLTHKLQKHQAFEAELLSNRGRVDSVQQVCTFDIILSPVSLTRISISTFLQWNLFCLVATHFSQNMLILRLGKEWSDLNLLKCLSYVTLYHYFTMQTFGLSIHLEMLTIL